MEPSLQEERSSERAVKEAERATARAIAAQDRAKKAEQARVKLNFSVAWLEPQLMRVALLPPPT